MKHLGIAAHSVEGAALCLRTFCHAGSRILGAHDHPDVSLDCVAMARSMTAWDDGDFAAIRARLAASIARLAMIGCDFFVCPDNTAHLALEVEGDDLAIPGLHIAEVVAERARQDGRTRVGILGTRYTMDGHVYPAAFSRLHIAWELPGKTERDAINTIIFEELVNGVLTTEARREFTTIIEGLARRGCDAVALVCTEIPLLVTPDSSPIPTLDSTRLLAQAALEVAIGTRPMPLWRGGPV
jgi:aspartate racemase